MSSATCAYCGQPEGSLRPCSQCRPRRAQSRRKVGYVHHVERHAVDCDCLICRMRDANGGLPIVESLRRVAHAAHSSARDDVAPPAGGGSEEPALSKPREEPS